MSTETECPMVVAGFACRVPGADSVTEFEQLLFAGRTGYGELPPERCDRSLYFDPVKGKTGKSYTTLGGIVPERPVDRNLCPLPARAEVLFDAAHVQFAEVAAAAWRHASLAPGDPRFVRTGVFVGHSGGTKSGGGLSLATQIEEALSFLSEVPEYQSLPATTRETIVREVASKIRHTRPLRRPGSIPSFHAYQAAALAGRVLGLNGPRSVIDAACASSLVALSHAIRSVRAGRIDAAIVGGATYNNVDNLILFSHSQACTATDSRPFDDGASGLVSSEGYVAVVVTTLDLARQAGLPVYGIIRSVGTASDGKGKSLWAPRMEGQVLALRRAYPEHSPLDIDYMEAHATSTQLGDATELETLRQLAAAPGSRITRQQLLLGSVKSNIGHTLEAAGLIGLVKVLIAMQRGMIPPSLRFERPNHNYDWETAPVRVVSTVTPWPDLPIHRNTQRAAVSAFGIGGLNAHVVVEGPVSDHGQRDAAPSVLPPTAEKVYPPEPIAVVGRGLVVAGASDVSEFAVLLNSNESALRDAPPDRWRNRIGVTGSDSPPETWQSPHCRGGFITDFRFDAARYRIPPKQVQQANPVQMMLIDAVSQLLREVSGNSAANPSEHAWPVDRQRIGVVIGTIFGGEFGDQLQVGMRLPEICRNLVDSMQKQGIAPAVADSVSDSFRTTVLKNRPALLDETGSFTASTLASRVAKTFDLMGGACALDSDDASGLAAISAAADQLRSHSVDMIICGSAQRSMSLSAFEALDLSGRLVRSGRTDDVPDDCHQILPGEGAVTLLLCRLSDAKRLGLKIFGILGETNPESVVDVVSENISAPDAVPDAGASAVAAATSVRNQSRVSCLDKNDATIVRKVGYLSGTHTLLRITAETIRSSSSSVCEIAAKTSDGLIFRTHFRSMLTASSGSDSAICASDESRNPEAAKLNSLNVPDQLHPPHEVHAGGSGRVPLFTSLFTPEVSKSSMNSQIIRFAASSGPSLVQLLKDVSHDTARFLSLPCSGVVRRTAQTQDVIPAGEHHQQQAESFHSEDRFRAIIFCSGPDQLRDRLTAVIKTAETGKFRTILDRERAVLWQISGDNARVAWLFPGQGSHYPEQPAVFSASDSARRILGLVDQHYTNLNLPPLSAAFSNAAIRPGEDVWWAQAWVLGVSAALIAALHEERLRPDAVLGHSFGEFTASLASGVTTLQQTIELARHRANAVMSHMRTPGGLLSVRAAVHEVDAILKSAALTAWVTHLNSPRQTVIAGSREGIQAARSLLDRQGLAAMAISVPAPFHTPLLSEAEVAFERMSASVPMRPPVCGFLSATSVQYLAEPSGIRQSLVRQLTQPVMYMPSIQRMLGEGFRIFLEVGPNDVLTRMNRDITDGQALALSLDVPGQSFAERLMLVHAALECVTGIRTETESSFGSGFRTRASSVTVAAHSSAPATADSGRTSAETKRGDSTAGVDDPVIDVTRSRRAQRKPTTGHAAETQNVIPDRAAHTATPAISEYTPSYNPSADFAPAATPSSSETVTSPAARHSTVEYSSGDTGSVQPETTSANAGFTEAQLRSFVRDLVVELTGYPPEIVDFEADLEADLGIDSIKKAQILGEIGEWMGLTVRPDSLRLDSVNTLSDAIRVAMKLAANAGLNLTPSAAEVVSEPAPQFSQGSSAEFRKPPEPPPVQSASPTEQSPLSSTAGPVGAAVLPSDDKLDTLLVDYVVDQTGYERDIVDIDADLEADLGLDSIKLAQLIGEMREQFNLTSLTLDSIAQARFRTLRGIREFLISHAGAARQTSSGSGVQHLTTASVSPNRDSADSPPDNRTTSGKRARHHSLPTDTTEPPHNGGAKKADFFSSAAADSDAIRGNPVVNSVSSGWSEWQRPQEAAAAGNGQPSREAVIQAGIRLGQENREQIRATLRTLMNSGVTADISQDWTPLDTAGFQGVAIGAGVAEESVRHAAAVMHSGIHSHGESLTSATLDDTANHVLRNESDISVIPPDSAEKTEKSGSTRGTHRYALRVVPAPRRTGMPLIPELHGPALILGVNPVAESLAERIRGLGRKAFLLNTECPIEEIEATLQNLWQQTATPHLFLTMAFDRTSTRTLDETTWKSRRAAALEAPFRICQLWMQKAIETGLMEKASVISVTQLGGDFGFSGQQVQSIEAIGGLVKAMLIESWMRGFRTTPMKAMDAAPGMSPSEIASGILQELAVPSYDMEIALRSSVRPDEPARYCVQAMAAPLKNTLYEGQRIRRGSTWIVSGGGRGITAVIAMTLAAKYDLKLHMLGTAPVPELNDDFVRRVAADRSAVRRQIMQDASARGENPVESWRNMEKAIEIDATLRECRQKHIEAVYHCCDVADFEDVSRTIGKIREQCGPVEGVIHGAGAGQDARFDRKRPDKVEKCLSAKIDGSLAIMQATMNDPLQFFVAFGSISGRFGANGHTDYSLANDMMAKIVDRYRRERPDVRSLTFHWHAWGDIGMATKPEAKLALEMIDMEFMPASDGINHFMRELECGGDEPEVLITDESYFRKFFPAERLSVSSRQSVTLPLPLLASSASQQHDGVRTHVVTLNPVTDRFLSQHRVNGRPTLPFVVALELMAEAARARTGGAPVCVCTDAQALQAIRFATDDPRAVTIRSERTADGRIECRLLADVRRRDGRMVQEDREHFLATFSVSSGERKLHLATPFSRPVTPDWNRIDYAAPDAVIYHGPELQELREVHDDGMTIFGRIAASAPVQLFGASRAGGFSVPCSTMDACLYAIGYAAWHRNRKPSLPVRFDQIEFGRLPDPGEPCMVRIQQRQTTASGATWDFQLQGHNGDRLMTVTGYQIGWLRTG